MTSSLVLKTGLAKRGVNGVEAIAFVDGDPRPADERWAEVKALPTPKVALGSEIWREDGQRIRLPFESLPWIIPDRTGVLVIFEDGEYVGADGKNVFEKPNNAAIYNSDGSLRFQLQLPSGVNAERIGGIHSGSMPNNLKDRMGVVVATAPEAHPEWVYAVNPDSPELIPTNQWVRW